MTKQQPQGERRPTLKDVAGLAGVDKSLVSRVVNEDPSITIPQSTRQRILDAVAELGYRPSAAARGLRTQRSMTVGLVLPDLANPVYAPIVAGAQSRAAETDHALILAGDHGTGEVELVASLVQLLAEDRVDGLIVASGDRHQTLLPALRHLAKPVVVVNRAVSGLPSAIVDDEGGSCVATAHLIDMNHRVIGHLAGPRDVETSTRRRMGYSRALKEAGYSSRSGRVTAAAGWTATDGYRAGLRLLAHEDLTAVFVANVTLAIGVYRAAYELGRRVPDDVSVIALHDYELASMVVPALTTVRMPLRELGRAAMDMMADQIQGRPGHDVIVDLPPVLLERESVRRL